MAGNFKGLTIEITGDATQLESVLLSIKRTSRSVQSEVEAVGKAMKLDPSNTALVSKFYGSMSEKLTLAKKQSEAMRQEQDKLNAKLKEYQQLLTGTPVGSDSYDKLVGEIEKAEAEQAQLTAKLNDYRAQLKALEGDANAYERVKKAIADAEKRQQELSEKIALYKMELQGLEKGSDAYNKVEAQLKRAEASQDVLNERLRVYKQNLESLKGNATRYSELKKEIDKAEEEQKQLNKRLQEYKTQLNGLEEGSKAYEQMQRQIEKTEYKLRDLNTQLMTNDVTIKQLEASMRLLDIKNATDGLAGFGNMSVRVGEGLKSFGDNLVSLTDSYTRFVGLAALVGAPKLIGSVEEYGNVISQIGGYLDITGDKLESLSELALYTGKETIYSATEAGQAISYLAKGGMTEAQIKAGALDATVSLAAAGQLDLADAAKVTAQAIAAFQLEAGDATLVADALAGAATNSVSSVRGLSTGFTQAASWARAAGWTINDVAGALALLSDYGLEAEMGGTALRNVLLRLAAPTDEASKAMAEYGIEVRDADGHMKSAIEVVQELSDAMAGMNDEERDSLVKTVFGTRGANAALALVDAGSAKLQEYIEYTKDTGAAGRMAQAQLGELGWAMELLRGEAETATVNFGNALTPALVTLAGKAEDALTQFNGLSKAEREVTARNALMIAGAPIAINMLGRLASGAGTLTIGLGKTARGAKGLFDAVKGGEGGVRALATAFSAASGATELTAEGIESARIALAGLKTTLIVGGVLVAIGLIAQDLHEVAEAERKAKEHADKLEAATDGLGRTARLTAPSIEAAGRSFEYYHRTAEEAAASSDSVLDAYVALNDTIADNNKQAQAQIDKLATVKQVLQDYANSDVPLTTEQLGELTWAVQTFNSEFGTNYEIIDKERGILGLEGEAVGDLTENFYNLIDARMKYAEAEAIIANMTGVMEQQSATRAEISKTTRELETAYKDLEYYQEEYERAQKRLEETSPWSSDWWAANESRDKAMAQYTEARERVAQLEASLREMNEALESGDITIEEYRRQLGELYSTAETTAEKLDILRSAVGDDMFAQLGDRAEEFSGRLDKFNADLEKAGQSQIDFSSLTQDQWAALVNAINADGYFLEDTLALITGNLDMSTSGWKTIIQNWANGLGVDGDYAMQAFAEGIASGDISVNGSIEDILNGAKDYVTSRATELEDAADESVSGSMAKGVDKGSVKVTASTKRTAKSVKDTLSGIDLTSSGDHMVSSLASGMNSAFYTSVIPTVGRITRYISDHLKHSRPKRGLLSTDDVWGLHMVQNLAKGIRRGIPYLESEVDSLTETMAGSLNDPSFYMSASTAQQVTVINIDGMRVNDDIGIRQNVIDFAYALKARERGYVG